MLAKTHSRTDNDSKKSSTFALAGHSFKDLRPIIIAAMFLLFFLSASGLFLTLPLARSGHVDFRHLYTAGYMVRTGHAAEIYDFAKSEEFQDQLVGPAEGALPFNHLAYETLIYVPFSFLSYRQAYFAFMVVNLMVLAGSVWMFRPLLLPLEQIWRWLPIAIVVCFLPVTIALVQGQDSLFLLALFIACGVQVRAGRDFRAGILVGLTLFKFQYALPVAFLFFAWRRWRFVAGFFLAAAAVSGISVWLTGLSVIPSYLHTIIGMSTKFTSANGFLYGVHPEGMPNLRGFIYIISARSTWFTNVLTLASSAAVVLYAYLKRPAFGTALLAALLVSYHQLISDTSLLLIPVGLALSWALESGSKGRVPVVVFACLAFLGPPVLLFAGTRFYPLVVPILGLFLSWASSDRQPGDGPETVMSTIGDEGGARRAR
jgi:Glycosyltransferase family 87